MTPYLTQHSPPAFVAMFPPIEQNALLAAILDFRDEDQDRRLMGAEDDDYRAMGLPYGAKDGDFEDIEELRLVPGMTTEIYERLRPLVTVFSGHGGVNPWVAGRDVLLALPGSSAEAVDAFIEARNLSALDPGLPPPPAPAGVTGSFLTRRVGFVHLVRVESAIPSGSMFRLEAVIRLHRPLGRYEGRPYEVLSWVEGGRFSLPLPEGVQ